MLTLFQQLVAACYPIGCHALTLTYQNEKGGRCRVVDMRQITDPKTQLYQYVTWSVPTFLRDSAYRGDYSFLWQDVDGADATYLRKKHQSPAPGEPEVYCWEDAHPWVVIEIDYLLVDKGQTNDTALCRLQAQAIAWAVQQSGYPYTAIIDSGAKSCHIVTRLLDDANTLFEFRTRHTMQRLTEMLHMVFGSFDEGVFKQAGRYKLVRAPGAIRENGAVQEILAVGKPRMVRDVLQWIDYQLRPEVLCEVNSRAPLTKESQRRWKLRSHYRHLLQQDLQPGVRGSTAAFMCQQIALCGVRNVEVTNEGIIVAPFLWWFGAYVMHARSGGWFFSDREEDRDQQKYRQYDWVEIQGVLQEQLEYESKNPKRGGALAEAAIQQQQQQQQHTTAISMLGGNNTRGGSREAADYMYFIEEFLESFPRTRLKAIQIDKGCIWMFFNGKYWIELSEGSVQSKLHQSFRCLYKQNKFRDVWGFLKLEYIISEEEWGEPRRVVVFNNGTLRVEESIQETKMVFYKNQFDCEDYQTRIIPIDYDPNAHCPYFMQWLNEIQPDKSVQWFLQQMMGYFLIPGNFLQLIFLNHGVTGSNGKSTFCNIVRMVVGDKNFAAINLASLNKEYALMGKDKSLVLYDDDITNARMKGQYDEGPIDIIKKISGNSAVSVGIKFKGSFTVQLPGKLLLNANDKPAWITSADSGFWRRLVVIPWEKSIAASAVVPNYHLRFTSELSGILTWAVAGLNFIMTNLTKNIQIPQAITNGKAEFMGDSDMVAYFIQCYMVETNDPCWHVLRPVYECYRKECIVMGAGALSLPNFCNRLKINGVSTGRPIENRNKPQNRPVEHNGLPEKGRYPHCYKGMKCVHPDFSVSVSTQNRVIQFPTSGA